MNNLLAEQNVIGGILVDGNKFPDVADLIDHNDFGDQRHQECFMAISSMFAKSEPVEIFTVLETMSDMGFVADFSYFASVAKNTPSTANITAYAKSVKNQSIERRYLSIANEMTAVICGEGSTAEKTERVEQLVTALGNDDGAELRDSSTVMSSVVRQWQERSERDGSLMGYSTGFKSFDDRTMGLQGPDFTVIAAASGKGKTTLGMNIAEAVCAFQNKPVLVFSLEMSAEQLLDRMTASIGKIPLSRIRNGTIFGSEYDHAILPTANRIKNAPLFIDDRGGLSIGQIQARARKFFRRYGEGLLVVDYIGLVKGVGNNKQEQTASVSGGLKALAKELNIPVLGLAQLNRNSVSRSEKRPVASDLRDSAAIEHDADCLIMLYCDEQQAPQTTEAHFVKLRNGETGVDYLDKQFHICRFNQQDSGFKPAPTEKGFYDD